MVKQVLALLVLAVPAFAGGMQQSDMNGGGGVNKWGEGWAPSSSSKEAWVEVASTPSNVWEKHTSTSSAQQWEETTSTSTWEEPTWTSSSESWEPTTTYPPWTSEKPTITHTWPHSKNVTTVTVSCSGSTTLPTQNTTSTAVVTLHSTATNVVTVLAESSSRTAAPPPSSASVTPVFTGAASPNVQSAAGLLAAIVGAMVLL